MRADGRVNVHYVGYPDDQDEWVPSDHIRPCVPPQFPVNAPVDAEWHGRWYPATVREGRMGIHLVHYEGFDDTWDEWVSSRRIRARASSASP